MYFVDTKYLFFYFFNTQHKFFPGSLLANQYLSHVTTCASFLFFFLSYHPATVETHI